MILARLEPTVMVEAVWKIHPQRLWQQGYRALILDLDNTIVDWNQEALRPEVLAWAQACRKLGFSLCICTNARRRPRVARIAARLGACYVITAGKPWPKACRRALNLLRCSPKQAVMIGDQVFTDIWGANWLGVTTILVRPLCGRDFPATKITRFFERRVLRRLAEMGKSFQEGLP